MSLILSIFSDDIDWESINEELALIQWVQKFDGLDPQEKLNSFLLTCETIMKKHVPLKKIHTNSRRGNIPRDRRLLMRRRTKVTKQLAKFPNGAAKTRLNQELIAIEIKGVLPACIVGTRAQGYRCN